MKDLFLYEWHKNNLIFYLKSLTAFIAFLFLNKETVYLIYNYFIKFHIFLVVFMLSVFFAKYKEITNILHDIFAVFSGLTLYLLFDNVSKNNVPFFLIYIILVKISAYLLSKIITENFYYKNSIVIWNASYFFSLIDFKYCILGLILQLSYFYKSKPSNNIFEYYNTLHTFLHISIIEIFYFFLHYQSVINLL